MVPSLTHTCPHRKWWHAVPWCRGRCLHGSDSGLVLSEPLLWYLTGQCPHAGSGRPHVGAALPLGSSSHKAAGDLLSSALGFMPPLHVSPGSRVLPSAHQERRHQGTFPRSQLTGRRDGAQLGPRCSLWAVTFPRHVSSGGLSPQA